MKFLWKKRENEFSKEFYPKKERRIYQYLCGYRILFWQLKEDELFHTYREWESYVKKKCRKFKLDQLREFQKFINHKKRVSDHVVKMLSIMVTAVITVFFSEGVIKFLKSACTEENILAVIIGGILAFIGLLIMCPIVIKVMDYIMLSARLEVLFYEDYQQIINEVMNGKMKESNS